MSFYSSTTGENSGNMALGLTAAGTTQANALALNASNTYNQVTVCAAGAGVSLPLMSLNQEITVKNDSANNLLIYGFYSTAASGLPAATSVIESLAANVAYILAPLASVTFICSNVSFSNTLDKGRITGRTGIHVNYKIKYQIGPSPCIPLATTADAALYVLPIYHDAIFKVSSAAAVAVTLPNETAYEGLRYRFQVGTTLANDITISSAAAGNVCGTCMVGPVGGALGITAVNKDAVVLKATAVVGDYVEVISNGGKWIANGMSGVTAGITLP